MLLGSGGINTRNDPFLREGVRVALITYPADNSRITVYQTGQDQAGFWPLADDNYEARLYSAGQITASCAC